MPAPIDRLRRLPGLLLAALFASGFVPELLPMLALAQTPAWPTTAEMEKAKQERPFPQIGQIELPIVPKPPQLVSPPGEIDFEAIARAGAQLANGIDASMAAQTTGQSPLRIFVTLAMPSASLHQLVDQASRTGAILVLRGLEDQSMMRTLATVRELIGDKELAWQIDPQAFDRFDVKQAPTFVLELNQSHAANTEQACGASGSIKRSGPDAFISVTG